VSFRKKTVAMQRLAQYNIKMADSFQNKKKTGAKMNETAFVLVPLKVI